VQAPPRSRGQPPPAPRPSPRVAPQPRPRVTRRQRQRRCRQRRPRRRNREPQRNREPPPRHKALQRCPRPRWDSPRWWRASRPPRHDPARRPNRRAQHQGRPAPAARHGLEALLQARCRFRRPPAAAPLLPSPPLRLLARRTPRRGRAPRAQHPARAHRRRLRPPAGPRRAAPRPRLWASILHPARPPWRRPRGPLQRAVRCRTQLRGRLPRARVWPPALRLRLRPSRRRRPPRPPPPERQLLLEPPPPERQEPPRARPARRVPPLRRGGPRRGRTRNRRPSGRPCRRRLAPIPTVPGRHPPAG
jgi:hypothetical protein